MSKKMEKVHNGKIYLSGSMEFAPDGQLGGSWRQLCSEKLEELKFIPINITALDIAYTKEHGQLFIPKDNLLQMKSNLRRHFVYTDLKLIEDDSDAVILLYDEGVRKGAGSISEMQHAYNYHVPIFVVNDFDSIEELPGWLISLSTKIFNTFDELYEYLEALPPHIFQRDVYDNHKSGNKYLCSLCGDAFTKHKHHFVSTINPLYCTPCVDIVAKTYETHADRYQFMTEFLEDES